MEVKYLEDRRFFSPCFHLPEQPILGLPTIFDHTQLGFLEKVSRRLLRRPKAQGPKALAGRPDVSPGLHGGRRGGHPGHGSDRSVFCFFGDRWRKTRGGGGGGSETLGGGGSERGSQPEWIWVSVLLLACFLVCWFCCSVVLFIFRRGLQKAKYFATMPRVVEVWVKIKPPEDCRCSVHVSS